MLRIIVHSDDSREITIDNEKDLNNYEKEYVKEYDVINFVCSNCKNEQSFIDVFPFIKYGNLSCLECYNSMNKAILTFEVKVETIAEAKKLALKVKDRFKNFEIVSVEEKT